MIVGGYTLDLYCDGPRHRELHPTHYNSLDAQFSGPSEADCRRQARAKGWQFSRDHKCYCKVCRAAKAATQPPFKEGEKI